MERVVFACGFRHERIREYFGGGEGFGVEVEYSVEGEEDPLGTGGAGFIGSYLVDRLMGMGYNEGEELDLMRDLLSSLVKNGRLVKGYVTDAFWYDVGSIERYEKLSDDVMEKHLIG